MSVFHFQFPISNFLVSLLFVVIFFARAGAAELDLPVDPSGDRLQVEAGRIVVRKARQVEATDGVEIVAPGLRARAERLVYDRVAGTIDVDGGIRMTLDLGEEEASIQALSATFDVRTKAGVLRDATIEGAGILIEGKRIARSESGAYRIDEARFSPCRCEDGSSSWEISAARISARPSGIAVMQGGVLRAHGVPILFLPIGFAPFSSERATGFLSPQFSPGGNDGFVATLPFYLAVARSWDLTLEPGYNQQRGPFVGVASRFSNRRGHGELGFTWHADEKIRGEAAVFPGSADDYSSNRWHGSARVTEEVMRSTLLKARVDLAGDDRYGFDFGPNITERSRPEYESNLFLERRGNVVGLVAGSTYYQDLRVVGSAGPYNSAQTVSRLGSVDASAAAIPLLGRPGLRLTADLGAQYELFDNVSSPQGSFRRGGELSGAPRRQVQHLRVDPAIRLPVSLWRDGVRMSAFAGGVGDLSADPLGGDTRARFFPEAGAELRAEWRRTFGEEIRLQHRIGPVLRWTRTPEVYGEALTSFEGPAAVPVVGDRVDVGITNRLLFRRRVERQRRMPVRELLEVALLERFRPGGPEEGESVANVDLRTGPLRFDLDAVVDNRTGSMTGAGGRAATRAGAPEGISLEYAYAPERSSHQGTAGAWLKLAELTRSRRPFARILQTLTVESGARYDFERDEFLVVSGGIVYESPCGCWGVRLGAARETDREETSFRFSIDLHPPSGIRRFRPAPGGA